MNAHELPDGSILDTRANLPDLSDILTAKEVADFFGVTERSIAAWRIPHASIGAHRFYLKRTLVAWIVAREGK